MSIDTFPVPYKDSYFFPKVKKLRYTLRDKILNNIILEPLTELEIKRRLYTYKESKIEGCLRELCKEDVINKLDMVEGIFYALNEWFFGFF